jgi:predicted AlkP superfamily pyrophosphatase or phosphodiesterase
MSIMLPSLNSASLSLADVLPSCLSSLGIPTFPNKLNLPQVNSAVVVLVDGLGSQNLQSAGAHARFLNQLSKASTTLNTVFPSTTAAALASLTTGTTPGQHGMTGYKVRDPESGEILNLLTGLGSLTNLSDWISHKPLYRVAVDHGMSSTVVAHPRFASTPLTQLIHAGASQVGAKSLDDRVQAVLSTLSQPGQHLVVLYISELDELAHNKGVSSSEWATALESLDGALKHLSEQLPQDAGMFVTADHGVLDIPSSSHFLYGNDIEHMEYIAQVGGEPRCLQLYFAASANSEQRAKALEAWRSDWSEHAWVLSKTEVIDAGLYGLVSSVSAERLGDVFVLAKKDVAFYDERDHTLKGRNMIGQHGGVSPIEMTIPGIRLGAYA